MARPFRFLAVMASFTITIAVQAQQSPFLPEDTYSKLVNEISGDIAYDNQIGRASCRERVYVLV